MRPYGLIQARTGDTGAKGASMMKMSGSQGNLLVHARVRHGGGGREEHIKTNSGATGEPEHECRRDAKRQRSEDFGGELFFFSGAGGSKAHTILCIHNNISSLRPHILAP